MGGGFLQSHLRVWAKEAIQTPKTEGRHEDHLDQCLFLQANSGVMGGGKSVQKLAPQQIFADGLNEMHEIFEVNVAHTRQSVD